MDSLQDGTAKEAFKVGEGLSSEFPDFQTKVHPVHRSQSVNSVHGGRSTRAHTEHFTSAATPHCSCFSTTPDCRPRLMTSSGVDERLEVS